MRTPPRIDANKQQLLHIQQLFERLGLPGPGLGREHCRFIVAAGLPLPALMQRMQPWLKSLSMSQARALADELRRKLEDQACGDPILPYPARIAGDVEAAVMAIQRIGWHGQAVERLRALEDVGVALGRALENAIPEARIGRAAGMGG